MTNAERKIMLAAKDAAYAAYVKADKEATHANELRNTLCDAWLKWCEFEDAIEREEAQKNAETLIAKVERAEKPLDDAE